MIRTDYVHITSISPHQSAKLLLFEFVPLNDSKYLIRFFSEYGAPGPTDPASRYYRACLYLNDKTVLRVRVTVTGEGLRRPLEFRLETRKDILVRVLKYADRNGREYDMNKAVKELQRLLRYQL